MSSSNSQAVVPRVRRKQRGYILLTLMVVVGLLAITAVAMAPLLAFQLRRDREEEMVHRGVQYSRAVRRYYKQFGRYPTRVEDLESSNNKRFLRKRYKDPITGKDFKMLHVGEVKMNFAGGIAGATPAGLNPGGQNQAFVNQGLPGGGFGARGGGGAGGVGLVGTPAGGAQPAPPQTSDSDSDTAADKGSSPSPASSDNSQSSENGVDFSKSGNSNNQVFGGGAIVGVVSTSTDKTIREFNDKKHYNEWQFIYDPTMDRGGLLTGPGQPKMAGNSQQQQQQQPIGAGGQPGQGMAQPTPPTPPPGNQGNNDNDNDN